MLLESHSNKTQKYIDSLPTCSLSLPFSSMCQLVLLCRQNTEKGNQQLVKMSGLCHRWGWKMIPHLSPETSWPYFLWIKDFPVLWLPISNFNQPENNWLGPYSQGPLFWEHMINFHLPSPSNKWWRFSDGAIFACGDSHRFYRKCLVILFVLHPLI